MNNIMKYVLLLCIGAAATFAYMHFKSSDHEYLMILSSNHSAQTSQSIIHSNKHQHDEVNMPGLQGKDTTEQEVNDLKTIFRSHKGISRFVSKLPNGIVTVTEAQNVELREAIVSHVSMMITRLQEGKNPRVIIQSPTLDALSNVYNEINAEIEITDTGVKVIQTSANADVVKLLHTHAEEVSDMAKRGMEAVHERMSVNQH